MTEDVFQPWLKKWRLTRDGDAIVSRVGNQLLPVRQGQARAMLKIIRHQDEQRGAETLEWYGGLGAVPVRKRDGEGLLMDRLEGSRSLAQMAHGDKDDDATAALCSVVSVLHQPRPRPPPNLVHLSTWFVDLRRTAAKEGGRFQRSAEMASDLLANPVAVGVLHGDIHHDNVLDGGEAGWLAIDPKGLLGEATYDYANLLQNPDQSFAQAPGRLAHRVFILSRQTGLDGRRILQWAVAFSGLSAAWDLEDGRSPDGGLTIAEQAAHELDR